MTTVPVDDFARGIHGTDRTGAVLGGLDAAGFSTITTEIKAAPEFYYAEEDHQQYLAKNPMGYCGLNGTGVTCG